MADGLSVILMALAVGFLISLIFMPIVWGILLLIFKLVPRQHWREIDIYLIRRFFPVLITLAALIFGKKRKRRRYWR